MKARVITSAISIAMLSFAISAGAQDRDRLLRFDGGIGVDPVSGISAGAPVLNVVRGTQPGGVPWVIERLRAEIRVDGSISADGRGLLLAGGNNIGTNGGQSVRAILFCGTVSHTTTVTGVPLEADGDFRIDDTLTPPPPSPCNDPVLLIANPAGRWFAAGILKR
jgi:hypothetical protein